MGDQHGSTASRSVTREPLSPVLLLERTLRVFPGRVALVHGDLEWTYSRLAEEVGRLAGALERAGVGETLLQAFVWVDRRESG